MLALLLILALAVNGGVFAGTILYSARKAHRFGQLSSMANNMRPMTYFS